MFKIAMDSTYIIALINKKDKNHKLASCMAHAIRSHYGLYIPFESYSHIMDYTKDCNNNIKERIKSVLYWNTNILFPKRDNLIKASNTYEQQKNNLSFQDCILLESMKDRGIRFIISFDEKWKNVDGIKRVSAVNDNQRLYFPK